MFIASIAERGSSGDGFIVRLSEGSSFFISSSFLETHSLVEKQDVGEILLENLQAESDRLEALQKAGDLLARAEQSSGGLYRKLLQRGFSESAARSAVAGSVELGLLDDVRFARFWISARLRQHPEGRDALYKGLLSRGVRGESARSALDEVLQEEDLLQALQKAGDKLSRRYKDDERKISQALYRRGFTSSQIRSYFENKNI